MERDDHHSSPEVVNRVERGYAELGLVCDSVVDSDGFAIHRLHMENLSADLTARGDAIPAFSREQLLVEPRILPPKTCTPRRALECELGGSSR